MNITSGLQKIIKVTAAATLLVLGSTAAQASTMLDITTLPGYGVATSASFNFNAAGGWAGWSVPVGKVVLGAKIISSGDTFSDFAVFRPAAPLEAFPHYTFGANEYGWVMQAKSGQANNGVQMELYYADLMPGYTISQSSQFNYNGAGGFGGWSAPAGNVVTGGGYQFVNAYSSALQSTIGLENSVWPHYTFGAAEQGWVVQGAANNLPNPGKVYVVSINTVPEPSTIALIAMALLSMFGLGMMRRRAEA
jgi:hypothetical protein